MPLFEFNVLLLLVCISLIISQLMVKKKQASHLIFAVFCGSLAIMFSSRLSGDTLGPYQYLLAMGACATCNGYWLLSRSIFRTEKAIQTPHLALAAAIAVLVVLNQGYLFFNSLQATSLDAGYLRHTLRELTILLSSCILVLSFWEGLRGFKKDNKTGKAQRILFLSTFGFAVLTSKVLKGVFADEPAAMEFVTLCITLMIVVNTQILMAWRQRTSQSNNTIEASQDEVVTTDSVGNKTSEVNGEYDQLLAKQVEKLIVNDSLYLQANLKVSDVAQQLSLPEYRISKALRYYLNAKNFNQYINELRIQHAQALLADPNNQKWPVLVVGLESGFASIGPFTRTFKSITGLTPNQYRKQVLTANLNVMDNIPASA